MTSGALTVDFRANLREILRKRISRAIDWFWESFLAIIVRLPDPKTRRYALFNKIQFLLIWLLCLEDISLGSPKSHTIEIFNQTTSHKNLVILAFIGASHRARSPQDRPRLNSGADADGRTAGYKKGYFAKSGNFWQQIRLVPGNWDIGDYRHIDVVDKPGQCRFIGSAKWAVYLFFLRFLQCSS